ncbi:guanylate kinase [Blastocystis sp. subtype 4]|uniref:guanylate kinase n=1 Tax=Blastocystis sp. subtype 4 TaxID=944170 RepID=UPI0007114D97|nr:guanylate kinase [Blastocystis sp. subtype 4]KNB44000.1 guanylate kinase [Blastocystis sp. subtype 4]|eukprot:XP_014527443.1 guanylate kinase [Blastocystis sp. subtype 4]
MIQRTALLLFVLCGPSGVGKSTLIKMLMTEFPNSFGFSVSHTTRAPRGQEVDGVDYYFTKKEDMEKEIAEGKFIEHANVHGNIYGTSFESVMRVVNNHKICILDIDVQGVQQVMKSGMKAEFVFIKPPTFEELARRLRGRGTDAPEAIELRLKNCQHELEMAETLGFTHVIVNNNLEEAYQQLRAIVLPTIEKMNSYVC